TDRALMSRDGKYVAAFFKESGRITVLNRATGEETSRVDPALRSTWVMGIAESPEGHLLVSTADMEVERVVNLDTGKVLVDIRNFRNEAGQLTSDGRWFAVTVLDAGVDVYSTSNGERVASFDFLDAPDLEASARLDDEGRWHFSGRDAELLHNEYFCRFGRVYAPRELCEPETR